jgi:hypothetical protein
MPPCASPRPFFSRRSQHGRQIWNVQPGQRSIVSLLRLSHSVHFAVWTLTTVMRLGSAEQVRSVPLAVRMDAPGVLGATALGEDAAVGEEAPGVAGRGIGEFVGPAWLGEDGVFPGEDMLAYRLEPEEFSCDVAQSRVLGLICEG